MDVIMSLCDRVWVLAQGQWGMGQKSVGAGERKL